MAAGSGGFEGGGRGTDASGVDRVGEGELAIGLVVEQIVEHGQQRHRLLLDAPPGARPARRPPGCSVLRCSGGSVPAASCAASGRSSAATARSVSCSSVSRWQIAVAGLGHAREQRVLLLEAEVMADLVLELASVAAARPATSVVASPEAQSVADAIEQRDAAAVFVVEQSGRSGA